MEISAGFIIFLVLVSPFALWVIIFFVGTITGFIKLLRNRHKSHGDDFPLQN